jgi:hypothetical protein
MTNTQAVQNTLVAVNTDDLPSPDAANAGTSVNNTGSTPDVVDSGRISFGAAARLPVSTSLPRPAGTVSSVTDSGRISLGAAARLPVSK